MKKYKKVYDNDATLLLTEEERIAEWSEVEDLVMIYQTYLNHSTESYKSKEAADILLHKFAPLFKSYLILIRTNQIDWNSKEQKIFVAQFIGSIELKRALHRKKTTAEYKNAIYTAFRFVSSTYGKLSEEDILSDLYMCFLILMKRYRQTGKNFCAYVANCFHYEVSRHIKKQIANPLTIDYKNCKYEDIINGNEDNGMNLIHEDNYYESITGLPDYTWINGETCSEIFSDLTPFQRKILITYYLRDCNDRQISELNGTNIGTINSKRRDAINKLCKIQGIDYKDLPKKRKSGKFTK